MVGLLSSTGNAAKNRGRPSVSKIELLKPLSVNFFYYQPYSLTHLLLIMTEWQVKLKIFRESYGKT